uniref:Kazal-like domain-containing protein n=1 Tax=Poecilia mexicana TaxID=48701 RepID=A0A3B3YXT1_9TELE
TLPLTLATCIYGCTKIMRPVCGTDGVTYANNCLLSAPHLKDSHINFVN